MECALWSCAAQRALLLSAAQRRRCILPAMAQTAAMPVAHASPQGTLRFAPGTRPKRLQMCETWRECGECFMYKCEYCHGEVGGASGGGIAAISRACYCYRAYSTAHGEEGAVLPAGKCWGRYAALLSRGVWCCPGEVGSVFL